MNAAETISPPVNGFDRTDWRSFAATTAVAFVGYWFTLAPNLTLSFSGELSTAALYAGVPNPPGYPAWVLASWLWIKIFPFGNIAWRLAVESALCASLAGGLVALMVSRTGALLLGAQENFRRLPAKDVKILCASAGIAAGLGFCFDRAVWFSAVRVDDVWASNLFFWALTVCLLMKWSLAPARSRWLLAAMFIYAITLTDCQVLLGAVFGLMLFIAQQRPALGRDVGLMVVLFCIASALAAQFNIPFPLNEYLGYSSTMRDVIVLMGSVATVLSVAVTGNTRQLLTEWKTILLMTLLFCCGLGLAFYLPLTSMSNPPMNWGYPRTVEGYIHAITRGQFERAFLSSDFGGYFRSLALILRQAADGLGSIYLVAALSTFGFLNRATPECRRWLVGLWGLAVLTLMLTVWALNPRSDRSAVALIGIFFTPVHLIIAVLAGCGMVWLGAWLMQPSSEPSGSQG